MIPLLATVVHYMALHGAAVVPFAFRRSGKIVSFFFGTDLIMGSSGEVTQGSHGFTQVGLFIYFFISCCLPPLCVFGHLVEYTGIGILVLVWFFACILRPMFAP